MKWTTSTRWGLAAAALCCGLIVIALAELAPQERSGGGWVPFVATRIATNYDLSGGQRKLVSERVGPYARDANGSIYYRAVVIFGSGYGGLGEAPAATLQDRTTGITYRIDYAAHEAIIGSRPPAGDAWIPPSPPTAKSWAAEHRASLYRGTKALDGIEIEGFRGRPSARGLTGEFWNAPALNYAAVVSKIVDGARHAELDVALENIQVGVSDPALFRVPAGFKILEHQ